MKPGAMMTFYHSYLQDVLPRVVNPVPVIIRLDISLPRSRHDPAGDDVYYTGMI